MLIRIVFWLSAAGLPFAGVFLCSWMVACFTKSPTAIKITGYVFFPALLLLLSYIPPVERIWKEKLGIER
jgi:hypothetical protein